MLKTNRDSKKQSLSSSGGKMEKVKSVLKPPVYKEFKIIGSPEVSKEIVEKIVAEVFHSLHIDAEIEGVEGTMNIRNFRTKETTVFNGAVVRIDPKDLEKLNEGRILIVC